MHWYYGSKVRSGVCECYWNEHRNWINNNTSVIVKHHLLDFISPGEHFLRDIFTSHNNRTYIEEHPQRVHLSQEYIYYYSHNNGSSQKACSPGYISPGESTHNRAVTHMSIRRPVLRRLANRKPDYQPPTIRKPDYPPPTQRFSVASPRTGKLPTRRISLPLCQARWMAATL